MQFSSDRSQESLYEQLGQSSCSEGDMAPGENYPFDDPYLEAAFQALRGNDWVWEEPTSEPDALELPSIDPPSQLNTPNLNNQPDSCAMDGQCHPFDPVPSVSAVPQDLNVLDNANTAPIIRHPDQSGHRTDWETQVSQTRLQPSHISSEKSNHDDSSSVTVKQSHLELGNSESPASTASNHCNGQPFQHWQSSHGYPAQPVYNIQHAAYTHIYLWNTVTQPQNNTIQPPHQGHPAQPIPTPSPTILYPGVATKYIPIPTMHYSNLFVLPPSSAGYPTPQNPTNPANPGPPPPPPAAAPPQPNPPSPPPVAAAASAPANPYLVENRGPFTQRTMALLNRYFPEPDWICQLCTCCGIIQGYEQEDHRLEHLASAHVIQVIKDTKTYRGFRQSNRGKLHHPMLINSRQRFEYARDVVSQLHCKYCKKDTSAVLRDDTIREHMSTHRRLGEDKKMKEVARLIGLAAVDQAKWYSLSDKILCNLPL